MKIKEITPVSVMPGLFYARSCCRQALQTGNRRKKYFLKIALSFPKKRPINRLDSRNANISRKKGDAVMRIEAYNQIASIYKNK